MQGRHTFTAGLWLASLLLLALVVARGVPWLWPHLFPGPESETMRADEQQTVMTREFAMEVLHRTLNTLGATGEETGETLSLSRGVSARDLEVALRGHPRMGEAEVYVTRVDELLHRVRVFWRGQLVLETGLRPWLPERPVVSAADPPELGVVVLFGEEEPTELQRLGRWQSPLAFGLHPFAPHSIRSVRDATWASKGVVGLLNPARPFGEQVRAFVDASGVLLDQELPASADPVELLSALREEDLFLLDGREGASDRLSVLARKYDVSYLRRSAHLRPGRPEDLALARNLTVRRGYGMVTVDGSGPSIELLETFIEGASEDGYALRFPAEVAREHGRPQKP